MSPYRKPAPMPPHEPAVRQPMSQDGQFTLGLIAFVAIAVAFAFWWGSRPPAPPKPCSFYADWSAKDVPARCTKTFDAEK